MSVRGVMISLTCWPFRFTMLPIQRFSSSSSASSLTVSLTAATTSWAISSGSVDGSSRMPSTRRTAPVSTRMAVTTGHSASLPARSMGRARTRFASARRWAMAAGSTEQTNRATRPSSTSAPALTFSLTPPATATTAPARPPTT